MAILLPALALTLLFVWLRERGHAWRDALLRCAVSLAVVAQLGIEGLSLFQAISQGALIGLWLGVVLAAGALVWRQRRRRARDLGAPHPQEPWTLADRLLLACALLVASGVGLTALVSPPNTWDAMVYHLPRVIHWMQQGHLGQYPTHALKQLQMAPGAELLMLHVYGLAGGDRFINLVQWSSYVLAGVGASVIARDLGAARWGQVLAVVAALTIPQGVLYASGAKNDSVVALWLICSAALILDLRRSLSSATVALAGAALGLAVVTKPTAWLYVLPLIGMVLLSFPKSGAWPLIRRLPVALLVIGLLNAGFWTRNVQLTGKPWGASAESKEGKYHYANDHFGVGVLGSNVLRNVALHLKTPWPGVNRSIEEGANGLIRGLGEDPNDPGTTWSDTRFSVGPLSFHEGEAGNLIHALLALVSLTLLALVRRLRVNRALVLYSLGLALAFLAFCAVLRWQPWHTRLHLPLFVLGAAAVGVVYEGALSPLWSRVLGALLVISAVPFVLGNALRPFFSEGSIFEAPKEALYYLDRPEVRDAHLAALARIRASGCRRVGLHAPSSGYVYPLLALISESDPSVRFRYVDVRNESARFSTPEGAFDPCAVICLDCVRDPSLVRTAERPFRTEGVGAGTVLYFAAADAPGRSHAGSDPAQPGSDGRASAAATDAGASVFLHDACSGCAGGLLRATGLHQRETNQGTRFHWAAPDATLTLDLTRAAPVTLTLRLLTAFATGARQVSAQVNGAPSVVLSFAGTDFRAPQERQLRFDGRAGENQIRLRYLSEDRARFTGDPRDIAFGLALPLRLEETK